MPLYAFECRKCEHYFEVLQGINEEHESNCPECKTKKASRVYTAPHVVIQSNQAAAAKRKGVPMSRVERGRHLREERDKRKKDPQSHKDEISNELHK